MATLGKVFPEYQVTIRGTMATINCSSTTPARWWFNGNLLPIIGAAIIIKDINKKDSGEYTCYGHMDTDGSIRFKTKSTLLVASVSEERKFINLKRGEPATLDCTSTTTPLWFFEQSMIMPMSPPVLEQAQWVVTESAEWHHGGFYYCFGSHDNGATHFLETTRIRVFDVAPDFYITEGKSTAITCTSGSDDIMWRRAGSAITLTIFDQLQFNKASLHDSGEYVCTEKTKEGYTKNTLFPVIVVARLDDKIVPTKQVAKIGKSVTFRCENGDSNRWKFNKSEILPDNVIVRNGTDWTSLTVRNATPSNTGVYKCYGFLDNKLFVGYGKLKVLAKCQVRHYTEKIIELATFAGAYSNDISDINEKIFEDPDPSCIKEGVWTGRDPVHVRKNYRSSSTLNLFSIPTFMHFLYIIF